MVQCGHQKIYLTLQNTESNGGGGLTAVDVELCTSRQSALVGEDKVEVCFSSPEDGIVSPTTSKFGASNDCGTCGK